MRRLLLYLVLLGAAHAAVVLSAAEAGAQRLGEAVLPHAGLLRPGDLAGLLAGWHVVSADGFDQELHPVGALPVSSWALWMDGQPLHRDARGGHALNRLPLALHDIGAVEAVAEPVFHGGRIETGGAVHVRSRPPAGTLGARGTYWVGNETGDPGPLRYLGSTAPNVDHLGPDVELTGTAREGRAALRVSVLSRIHYPTDPALLPYLQRLALRYPRTAVRAASAFLDLEAVGGRHTVWGALSEADGFVPRAGRVPELPVHEAYGRLGMTGALPLARRYGLAYRAAFVHRRLAAAPNSAGLAFRWQPDVAEADAELRRTGRIVHATLGAGFTPSWVRETAAPGAFRREGLWRAYVDLRHARRPATSLSAVLATNGSRVAGSVLLSASRQVAPTHALRGSLVLAEHLPEALYGRRYARAGGPGLLDELGVGYYVQGRVGSAREYAAHLTWTYRPADGRTALAVQGWYREMRDVAVERGLARAVRGGDASERLQVVAGQAGRTAGLRLSLERCWTPQLRQTAGATWLGAAAGDPALRAWYRRQPTVQAFGLWVFAPAPSFSLSVLLRARTGTTWPSEPAAGTDEAVRAPGFWTVDAAATKWLGQRRLALRLSVHNLLNRPYRYEAAGASFPMALGIQLALRLPPG